MSYLYVCEQGASIGVAENRFQVKYKDGMLRSIPAETLEVIEVFGNVQVTTQCLAECLKRGVNIIFYSTYGAYYGRLNFNDTCQCTKAEKTGGSWKNEKFSLLFQKRSLMPKSEIRL